MNKLFFPVIFFLFFSNASAELLVGITPKTDGNFFALYPNETSEFVVSVFNDDEKTVENIVLRITVEEGLLILKNDSGQKQIIESIPVIGFTERERVIFKVRAGERPRENARITVEYGVVEFSNSVSTNVDIIDTPLRLEVRALRTTINVGDRSSIAVTAKNVGREKLENVLIELVLPAGVIPLSPPMIIPELPPGAAVVDKGFGFEFDPAIRGKKTITLRAVFTEAGKQRVLEKNIDIEAADKNIVVFGLLVVVVVLVLVAIFTRKKKKEKKEEKKEEPEHH